jgi:hypothetical protein
MDLAAAAGIRTTRMGLLQAGWGSWQTWAGATPHHGTTGNDYATAGSGPTRQSNARNSEMLQALQHLPR